MRNQEEIIEMQDRVDTSLQRWPDDEELLAIQDALRWVSDRGAPDDLLTFYLSEQ